MFLIFAMLVFGIMLMSGATVGVALVYTALSCICMGAFFMVIGLLVQWQISRMCNPRKSRVSHEYK